ncbi:MAG: M56 family metallopeptidase [Lachnospiraceae bacterium]|nr:M56 family metallopeptidase [Lachnospiraceae bacterium]
MNEWIVWIRDIVSFFTAYFVTIVSRCAIVSFPVLALILFLRKTVLRRTVFWKGAVWALLILVPFLGRLRIYYEVPLRRNPFLMCQEVAIRYPYIRYGYLAGILLLLRSSYRAHRDMRRLIRGSEERMIGGQRVFLSEAPVSPCAFGLFAPKIIVPRIMMEEFSQKEIRAVVLHERTHIRLGHLWLYVWMEVFCAFFWINPVVRLCEQRFKEDMEQICDRVTIRTGRQDPIHYGQLILKSVRCLREEPVRSSAMLIGEGNSREAKERFYKIRDYEPYRRSTIAGAALCGSLLIVAALLLLHSLSYPQYQTLPDITIMDEMGGVYADTKEVERSGAVECTGDGIIVDAEKLREILPEDFPGDQRVYIYYGIIMKIPGMGGGGYCAWVEEVPESGRIRPVTGEQTMRDKIAIWMIKRM